MNSQPRTHFNQLRPWTSPFILVDRVSRNVLGEFESLEDAQTDRLEVDAAPDAAESLEIWHGGIQVPVDQESLYASPAT